MPESVVTLAWHWEGQRCDHRWKKKKKVDGHEVPGIGSLRTPGDTDQGSKIFHSKITKGSPANLYQQYSDPEMEAVGKRFTGI